MGHRLTGVALVAAALALPATAQATTVRGKSGPLSASMVPSTHHPTIKQLWPLTVTATLNGKPAHATAKYEFLFNGLVVSTQYPRYNKHFTFTGKYTDKLGPFGSSSQGQPLTLRVVISDGGHTVDLDWAITTVA
jgi:hypothetical protein